MSAFNKLPCEMQIGQQKNIQFHLTHLVSLFYLHIPSALGYFFFFISVL